MGVIDWLLGRRKAPPQKLRPRPPTPTGSPGLRICSSCGTTWHSKHGEAKDMGMLKDAARVVVTYDAAKLLGLTCTRCGNSYCKKCMGGRIPFALPAGSCPGCGAPMFLG